MMTFSASRKVEVGIGNFSLATYWASIHLVQTCRHFRFQNEEGREPLFPFYEMQPGDSIDYLSFHILGTRDIKVENIWLYLQLSFHYAEQLEKVFFG